MMEMADGLGARSINVAVAFVSDQPFEKIAESFSNVCERVARFGLRADIEFLPWTQIGDLTTALKLLDHANQVNAGVMFDFWHFFNGDEDLDVLRNLTPSQVARITSLQLNDAPQLIAKLSRRQNWRYTKGMFQNVADGIKVLGLKSFLNVAAKSKYPHPDAQEMMKNALCSRLFPGCGVMPVLEVLSILCKKGAQPTIGIEVFNLDSQEQSAALRSEMAMSSYTQLTKSQKA